MAAPAGPKTDDPFAHTRMSLGEHLNELRRRLSRGVVALAVALVACLCYNRELTAVVLGPFRDTITKLNAYYVADYTARVEADPSLRERYFEPDGAFKYRIDDRLAAQTPTE